MKKINTTNNTVFTFTATTISVNGVTFDAKYSLSQKTGHLFVFAIVPAVGKVPALGLRVHITPDHPFYTEGVAAAKLAAAQQPKAETKPTEQPKAETKPAEQPKAEDKPAEQPKAETQPAEQPKAETAKPKATRKAKTPKQPKAETKAAEQPKAEDKPVEQPKAETQPAEQPKAETAKPKATRKAKTPKQPKAETNGAAPVEQPKAETKPTKQPKAETNGAAPVEQPKAVVGDKSWIGSTITGNGWHIAFDAEAGRTRVLFQSTPSDAQKAAIEKAGFFWSATMGSWNKGLTCKAHRAAVALAAELTALA